jgi:polar amino acid transport system substrate-binding protein
LPDQAVLLVEVPNAAINAFIDKIVANGELTKPYQKWMKLTPPQFPASLEGIPFVAS